MGEGKAGLITDVPAGLQSWPPLRSLRLDAAPFSRAPLQPPTPSGWTGRQRGGEEADALSVREGSA
jgi:hypothetical protein